MLSGPLPGATLTKFDVVKENPWPTCPVVKAEGPTHAAVSKVGPWMSFVFPSPAYHVTMFGGCSMQSSFVIVRTAVAGVPIDAPMPVAFDNRRLTVSGFSKTASLQIGMLKVFEVSVAAKLSVPAVVMKSVPAVQLVLPVAFPPATVA